MKIQTINHRDNRIYYNNITAIHICRNGRIIRGKRNRGEGYRKQEHPLF